MGKCWNHVPKISLEEAEAEDETSLAKNSDFTKSITFEPMGIFKRGKRYYVSLVVIFQYTNFQSDRAIE